MLGEMEKWSSRDVSNPVSLIINTFRNGLMSLSLQQRQGLLDTVPDLNPSPFKRRKHRNVQCPVQG